jgi:hypothetical protein
MHRESIRIIIVAYKQAEDKKHLVCQNRNEMENNRGKKLDFV